MDREGNWFNWKLFLKVSHDNFWCWGSCKSPQHIYVAQLLELVLLKCVGYLLYIGQETIDYCDLSTKKKGKRQLMIVLLLGVDWTNVFSFIFFCCLQEVNNASWLCLFLGNTFAGALCVYHLYLLLIAIWQNPSNYMWPHFLFVLLGLCWSCGGLLVEDIPATLPFVALDQFHSLSPGA